MPSYSRFFIALTALVVGGLLLIGAAAQLARMITPDTTSQASHKRISDVAPILIGGFLIGAAGQSADQAPADAPEASSGHAVLAMNKAELVG
ncbi:hypothetical protein [Streptomyces jumonjinensis]|uniref:hypothetical protein n=1 Tax=Streptomyces jumonjinensis TaxID=1945 RepID=UPI0037B599AB